MEKRLRAVSAAVIVGFGALGSAAHAYCVGWDKTLPSYDPHYYSVNHEFHRSKWVVEATVLNETWIGEDGKEKALEPPFQNGSRRPSGFDPYAGAFYELRVERAFKGHPPLAFKVFSENTTARYWLNKNQKILAFVSSEAFEAPIGKQLTLDTCGNFGPFPKAKIIMAAVLKSAKAKN